MTEYKIEEGKDYDLKVDGTIDLPDGVYYILVHVDGRRFLMNKAFYSDDYGISVGKSIRCRVDRINCSGKVFFEPYHPFYKPGDIDVFEITGQGKRMYKKSGEEYKVYFARNDKTEKALIKEPDNPIVANAKIGDKVKAGVKKMSKGEVHLLDVAFV